MLRLLKLFGLLVQLLGQLYIFEPLRRDWLFLLHSLRGFSHKDVLLDLWSVPMTLRYDGRLASQVSRWMVNGRGWREHNRRGSFPRRVAGPLLTLYAVERLLLLVLWVWDALGVDRRVELGRRLHSSAPLVDHWDWDVTRLETGAARAWRLVV